MMGDSIMGWQYTRRDLLELYEAGERNFDGIDINY
jgi:hypothetical protein